MKAKRDQCGRRILLDENTDGGAVIFFFFTVIGLLPGGSGYFTCIQNMKLVTTKFKSGGSPIRLQRDEVWISSGLFYIHLQATVGHM